jgi:IMP dehydrogenase
MTQKYNLSYDDVLLKPQYSNIRSRSNIDISTDLSEKLKLNLPIIASPMDTISESKMAAALNIEGGMAIIHRYNTIPEQVLLIKKSYKLSRANPIFGAAVGISGDYLERASELINIVVRVLCVDVAHGHHILMKEAIENIKGLPKMDRVHLMAGNVATLEGINDLSDWGADSVRCNIGGGSICSTRVQTGHGMPGLQTIFECAKTDRDVKIIADGGIKNSGDIVKALAAGADAVMVGSLLSGTDETPGEILTDQAGSKWKAYRGMASKEAQMDWRGKYSSYEGVTSRVPYRGSVRNILRDLEKGVRSGFSYSGARTLLELQSKAEFLLQTASGHSEGKTHITTRTW